MIRTVNSISPPFSAAGIDLQHLILLRCTNRADQLRALAECLHCRGVRATVAYTPRLNQIEARRLQLAAERGGGCSEVTKHTEKQG